LYTLEPSYLWIHDPFSDEKSGDFFRGEQPLPVNIFDPLFNFEEKWRLYPWGDSRATETKEKIDSKWEHNDRSTNSEEVPQYRGIP
jgi:hypothetical protein